MYYRYGTAVSLTENKQQYGTVYRFQSAIGTVITVTSTENAMKYGTVTVYGCRECFQTVAYTF